jgi:signal peptidase II
MRTLSRLLSGLAMAASAAALIALDLWTKGLAAAFLEGRGRVNLLGDFAVLVFVRNSGAFLSLGSGLPSALRAVFLIILPVAALLFLGWAFFAGRLGGPRGEQTEVGGPRLREKAVLVLIVAGGVGNLVDRILYGEVRDFLNFGIGRLRTGIMNLADLYILAALIIIAAAIIAGRKGRPPIA